MENDIKATKEALTQHLSESTKLHTMLTSLFTQIQTNLKTIVPNTCEYKVISEDLILRKVLSIATDYKAWYTHVTQELQVQVQALSIVGLGSS